MNVAPIAIVGRSCILPKSSSVEGFWSNLVSVRDLISDVDPTRWRVSLEKVLGSVQHHTADQTWTKRGGYIGQYEMKVHPMWDISTQEMVRMDEIHRLVLHTTTLALEEIGFAKREGTGLVLGNLSFPSASMSAYLESVWFPEFASRKVYPEHRSMSGSPALFAKKVLQLGGRAFALDTACASGLVAVKLACDRLHRKEADVMVAAGVNMADDLFIHIGFSALQALSKTGRSQPFSAEADGLIPAEGAGALVLKRLDDAIKDANHIYGVIRGTGWSNDGRGRGMLVPSSLGQIAAMEQAYRSAQIDPHTVQYVECHATGTVVGDATEIASMRHVFGETPLSISSLKANMGHSITVAGIAGMIKTIEAMQHSTLPSHPIVTAQNSALLSSNFRLLQENTEWKGDAPTGLKRAGVSAFGFGGNNAHVIVDSWQETAFVPLTQRVEQASTNTATNHDRFVIRALELYLGDHSNAASVVQAVAQGDALFAQKNPTEQLVLDSAWLRFPPKDIESSLPQQQVLLSLSQRIFAQIAQQTGEEIDHTRMGVWIGMQTDIEVCRYGARWRLEDWLGRQHSDAVEQYPVQQYKDAIIAPLHAAAVLGCMPNIPANRLNSQFNALGASGSVCAEEGSGWYALEIAMQSLASKEIDYALVGAVDFAKHDPTTMVHGEAKGNNSAVLFLLQRQSDVSLDQVLGEISLKEPEHHVQKPIPTWTNQDIGLTTASSALVQVALAVVDANRSGNAYVVQQRDKFANIYTTWISSTRVHTIPELCSLLLGTDSVARKPMFVPVEPMRIPMISKKQPRAPFLPPIDSLASMPVFRNQVAESNLSTPHIAINTNSAHREITIASVFQQEMHQLYQQHQQFIQLQDQLHHQFLAWNRDMQQALYRFQVSGVTTTDPVMPQGIGADSAVPSSTSVTMPLDPQSDTLYLSQPIVHESITEAPKSLVKPVEAKVSTVALVSPENLADLRSHRISYDAPLPEGLQLTREQLHVHASGAISTIYGEVFVAQDTHAIQTRMPEPPLLLADRVTGLRAAPASMKKGSIWTETDVLASSWYLHCGRMPAGIMIESGQADLMLISYLGIDLLTKGERAYRLLGCELMYHDDLPAVGDTLCYDIHVDGHAQHGDIRLFFFHYDCRINGKPRLSVRQGQAGFFTKAELANSEGVLWKPEEQEICPTPVLDTATYALQATTYSREQVRAFSEGRPWECFGTGLLRTKTHTRTPRIQNENMLFLRNSVFLDPQGGPWKRGYLSCTVDIHSNDWFFEGHFKNDPCMPGTLMFEGCLQAMAFYLTAMGYTNHRDGWRFQPIPNRKYPLICRGQVLPTSRKLTYEIFVEECSHGEKPYLIADLLCSVDGLKAFHARAMGLELVADYPISTPNELNIPPILVDESKQTIATDSDGFVFDYKAMIASAWGKPSDAFGAMYNIFDAGRRVARLPGPPYHFMSRVRSVTGNLGTRTVGTKIILDYDIPRDAWYFRENASPIMPFCVLLEAALQPCGWLASAVGSAVPEKEDLSFRNLDGVGTLHSDIVQFSEIQTFETHVTITKISKSAGMIIEGFDVECWINSTKIYTLQTVFGFFPDQALQNQVGLPVVDSERALFNAPANLAVDLTQQPSKFFTGSLRLPKPMLCMLDRITLYIPTGGTKGLGILRAEKDVRPEEWFFKAHFFRDPVQPGSLGIEAMIQLLQWYMIAQDLGKNIAHPRFTCLGLEKPMQWRYRGQVIPENSIITTTMEILEVGRDEIGVFARASASLWVDGKRIYQANNLCLQIVPS